MTPLSDLAFMRLSAFFNDNDSPLIGQHKDALRSFMTNLEEGLKGQLSRKYHLLSLDPGMGKTQACVHFIKAWRERDFQPSGSILIGVSTLSELQAFAEASALSPSEFAVLTSNEEMNNLGLPHNLHDEAKILFTSQQMIRSRTKGKLFAQASEFYFQGQPRSLRLWDETLLPNEPVVLRRDDMMRLVSPLRPLQLEFATELDGLINLMAKAQTGDVLKVPEALGLSRGQRHVARSAVLAGSDRDTFDHLQLMVGETMVARADERFGMCLVGTTPSLPADIVPLVIIDASGRVRTTYRLWEEHRGTLQRLPSAHNSYEGLLVHLWKASSGKDALAAASTRGKFAAAIVEAFKRDPEGEWLILTYKDSRDALEASIRNASGAAPLPSLHWMHWGVHKSTNRYRNVENVIIVGQSTYRPADYLGLTLAASGLPVESNNLPETNDTKVGEFKHNLLQAVCRASVRKASGGIAARCNAFIITSQGDSQQVLADVFPECAVLKWMDDDLPTGKIAEAIAHIQTHLIDAGAAEISKRSIRDGLGISAPNISTNVFQKEAFLAYLADQQLEMTTRTIRQTTCGFDEAN